MKRKGNLYEQIYSMSNLRLAYKKARKGKRNQYGVRVFARDIEGNLLKLHYALKNKTYKTPPYTGFKIFDPKERDILRLPFPDRVVHHAIMNIMESIFVSTFTADTYSCIKKRGIHAASKAVRRALRDEANTKYCLKLDIKKFYQNIDHGILKQLLRKKIKDKDLLWLLDEIIDSAEGVPIGNYLSQYFANFYLSYFDHYIKEVLRVRYYFRYADDMVFLASNKPHLHWILSDMRRYLSDELKLTLKANYQVFPVAARGIDFVGYVHFTYTHVLLRPSIKRRFARMLVINPNPQSIASYMGWLSHCNSNNLTNKLLHNGAYSKNRNKSVHRNRSGSKHRYGPSSARSIIPV